MRRREFISLGPAQALFARRVLAESVDGPESIPEPQFPSRQHLFVWRNWELANAERMAHVIRTTPRVILELGASMGLPEKPRLTEDQLARLYITVIRQNWHVLPEEQIVQLLGWTHERFQFTLKEDDFLNAKLGMVKPRCPALFYKPPSAAEKAGAADIRVAIRELFGNSIHKRGQESFHFIKVLSDPGIAPARDRFVSVARNEVELTQGWGLEAPAELAREAERFRSYLRQAMLVELQAGHAEKQVRLTIDRYRLVGNESFDIVVTPNEISITGHDRAGVLQGIYRLMDRMEARGGPFLKLQTVAEQPVWNPRYVYSYFALYGDPLLETKRDPFPDAYLERLARCGINGVWIQTVLNTLAPATQFPEFGKGWRGASKI